MKITLNVLVMCLISVFTAHHSTAQTGPKPPKALSLAEAFPNLTPAERAQKLQHFLSRFSLSKVWVIPFDAPQVYGPIPEPPLPVYWVEAQVVLFPAVADPCDPDNIWVDPHGTAHSSTTGDISYNKRYFCEFNAYWEYAAILAHEGAHWKRILGKCPIHICPDQATIDSWEDKYRAQWRYMKAEKGFLGLLDEVNAFEAEKKTWIHIFGGLSPTSSLRKDACAFYKQRILAIDGYAGMIDGSSRSLSDARAALNGNPSGTTNYPGFSGTMKNGMQSGLTNLAWEGFERTRNDFVACGILFGCN